MAVIRPFPAVRFASDSRDITALTAPPYDVVSPEERERLLAGSSHNVVALELPEGPLDPEAPGNRYEVGGKRWADWLASGVLRRDEPAVYVVEQTFQVAGKEIRRRGFIAAMRLEPFSAGVVLPHERTLPKAKTDRLNMLRATRANLSQIFGLFSDPEGVTDGAFDSAMADPPIAEATGIDGAVARLWAIHDAERIEAIAAALADKQVFIADGHHRYETSLAYRDERRAADAAAGTTPEDPVYDYVMTTLVNMDDPNLVVLPTHRVADAEGEFDEDRFWPRLGKMFAVTDAGDDPVGELLELDCAGFLVKTRSGATRIARLRDDVDLDESIPGEHSLAWKSLDVTILLEMVLWPIMGIHPDHPETLDRLKFVKDADDALAMAGTGPEQHHVVFLLNGTRMEQMREISLNGELMPQKSTYFFPKLLSGLVMRELG